MQLARIFYPVKTLGPGNRIGIWTVGCPHSCMNCSNPELWDEDPARNIPINRLKQMIGSVTHPIDGVTITGGDPLVQPDELAELVTWLSQHVSEDILIYTGYRLEEMQQSKNPSIAGILQHTAVLIDGVYIEEQNDNEPLRGSSNQRVHFLKEEFRKRYQEVLTGQRTVQTIFQGQDLLAIGIPVKRSADSLSEKLAEHGVNYTASHVEPPTNKPKRNRIS
ncbi:4Fe-4S single cluster domain-containing protein [Brevibacillus dissolubilis]|uniref:4Fe-4S single cluster domain-containing protein n=1 Tax=Brevibacillus dissolubilis TaxID=1844116 RepID=UPI0011169A07|nr:4Fe-4S single cluster domain-containing protein [Brevibacillus dissolubilis]